MLLTQTCNFVVNIFFLFLLLNKYVYIKKSCQSPEDCGELHENEASQVVVFSQEIDKIILKIIRSYAKGFHGKIVV